AGERARALCARRAGRRPGPPADRLPVRGAHGRPAGARPRAPLQALSGRYDGLSFQGEWRRYQRAAIPAFQRDRQARRRSTHIVAPPGSGKTLLGVELIRRVGSRALVLAPNQAIQQQWPRAVSQFTRERRDAVALIGPDVGRPIACLTYQALCQLEEPE